MPFAISRKTNHSRYCTPAGRAGLFFIAAILLLAGRSMAQYPGSCASVSSRANSNGQANSCPNVSGTSYAANFAGTAYATVPASSKTGNITLKYTGASASLKPFAITKVWQTNPSTVLLPISFGPAGTPTVSGSDILVSYCFYGANMPALGTVSFQFTNPETNAVFGICSFDASCNSNCGIVANPLTLPVELAYFNAKPINGSVELSWATQQEMNNRGFFIERSVDDSLFSPISFIPSPHPQGSSATQTTYSYTDSNIPSAAVLWYRLRQADFDGRFALSAIQAIRNGVKNQGVQVFASGGNMIVSISAGMPASPYQVTIYDAQGRLVAARSIHASAAIPLNGLTGRKSFCYVHISGSAVSAPYTKAVYLE